MSQHAAWSTVALFAFAACGGTDDAAGDAEDGAPGDATPSDGGGAFTHGGEGGAQTTCTAVSVKATTIRRPQWSPYLRSEAFKVFLQLSDTTSTSDMSASAFDAALLAVTPAQFGTATARNYVYHGILGLPLNSPVTSPWLPTDPVLQGSCSDNGLYGAAQPAYQEVAIASGGLRYPLCEPGHYDVVFQTIAAGVIEKSEIPCSLAKPTPASGTLDETTLVIRYTPGGGGGGGGGARAFDHVPDASQCHADAFYVTASTLELCPQACSAVRGDAGSSLDVEYGCPPAIH